MGPVRGPHSGEQLHADAQLLERGADASGQAALRGQALQPRREGPAVRELLFGDDSIQHNILFLPFLKRGSHTRFFRIFFLACVDVEHLTTAR
jgi:hypothetical protein